MLTNSQRQQLFQFETITIQHPRMTAIFSQFDDLRFKSRSVRTMSEVDRGRITSLSGMTMIAGTGSGKTKIINTYTERVASEVCSQDTRPVVVVNLSPGTTKKGFYADVLQEFGDPNFARGTEQQLKQRTKHYLDRCGVELLIIDEVHHLVSSETNKIKWDIAEIFKGILNDKSCCVVVSGIETARFLADGGSQFARRCIPPVNLGPLRLNIQAERELFLGFLGRLDERMAKDKITSGENGFLRGSMPAALHEVSNGVIGITMHLIYQALQCCFERGGTHIEIRDLAEATDKWAIPAGFAPRNPFITLLEAA